MGAIRRAARLISLALLLIATLAFAELVVCPKCGYENDATRAACSHCAAALPVKVDASTNVVPVGGGSSVLGPYLDEKIVEAELVEGRQSLAAGESELARLFVRNAAALDLLTDPALQTNRAAKIGPLLARCDQASRTVRKRCLDCNGSGRLALKATTLAGGPPDTVLPGRVCPTCQGTGTVLGYATVDEQKFAQGRALKKFGTQQQIRRYAAVGNAWVPGDMVDAFTVKQVARLKTAMASPCETCAGIGRISCRTCNGLGLVKCANRGCVAGRVEVDEGGQLGGKKIHRSEKCPVCGGTGSVACKKCTGVGSVVCTECNGSGARAVCRACTGQGYVGCKRCAGTGTYKGAPCGPCKGAAVVLCTGCGGDGRAR